MFKLLYFLTFSGRVLRCFSQRLAGGWYGGGLGPGVDKDCKKEDRINTGWPCYTEERPTVSCSGKYWNDYLYEKVSNRQEACDNWVCLLYF